MTIECKYNVGDIVTVEIGGDMFKERYKGIIGNLKIDSFGLSYHLENTVNLETGESTGSFDVREKDITGIRETPKLREDQIQNIQNLADRGYIINLWYDEYEERFKIEGKYKAKNGDLSTCGGDL